MKTIAYLRVSKDSQDVRNQRLAILEFARQEKFEVSAFMELSVSSRRSPKARQIGVGYGWGPNDTVRISQVYFANERSLPGLRGSGSTTGVPCNDPRSFPAAEPTRKAFCRMWRDHCSA